MSVRIPDLAVLVWLDSAEARWWSRCPAGFPCPRRALTRAAFRRWHDAAARRGEERQTSSRPNDRPPLAPAAQSRESTQLRSMTRGRAAAACPQDRARRWRDARVRSRQRVGRESGHEPAHQGAPCLGLPAVPRSRKVDPDVPVADRGQGRQRDRREPSPSPDPLRPCDWQQVRRLDARRDAQRVGP